MAAKTSQLQIRVSPAQKATLRRLAAGAGQSVSSYVLSVVLPSAQGEFAGRVEALREPRSRGKALAEMSSFLECLGSEDYLDAVAGIDLRDMPGVLPDLVAAAVERAAVHHGVDPPGWTADVAPRSRPYFASDLRSLRPHLMRVSPLAFKRRNVFVPPTGGLAATRGAVGTRGTSEDEARFALLDAELTQAGAEVELCLVGGAVSKIVFEADPPSRRPRDLFATAETLHLADQRVRERMELGATWLAASVRSLVGPARRLGGLFEGGALRVSAARPEYVLALRCLQIAFPPDERTAREARSDLSYLLTFLGVGGVDEALEILAPYLNERQRPDDLADVLETIL